MLFMIVKGERQEDVKMPIRITGMNSGLDTETIVSELVKVQRTKVDSVKKQQTKLQWKQDAWKELNSKIYKLFNGTVANMRFSNDYSKKITESTNSAAASIVTGDSAMNATQKLSVDSLATAGYMTGGAVAGNVTSSTKLSSIDGVEAGSTISVTTKGKTTDIEITADMTVNGLLEKLKSAGVEASFDEKNKRFHIAATASGKENDFNITASNRDGTNALKALGILDYASTLSVYQEHAALTGDAKDAVINADVDKQLAYYTSRRASLLKTYEEQEKALTNSRDAFKTAYGDSEDIEVALADKSNMQDRIDELKLIDSDTITDAEKEELATLEGKLAAVEKYQKQKDALAATQTSIDEIENNYLNIDPDDNSIVTGAKQGLRDKVTAEWNTKIAEAQYIIDNAADLNNSDVHKNEVTDAKITLNGVTYEGSSNTFEINGLTITALQKSDEEITLTTKQDTEGIYDMIKNFITEYNTLINEMDKLYNAEAAKGYEPLTDDEKKELSDSEVEKWETKIKDSILRKDSNLSTISMALKTVMLQGANVNGKQMYLSNFGIETAGYFASAENEKNAYHISGDKEDSTVANKENELKTAIANDPDTVVNFFAGLVNNLYKELNNQSKSIEGIRTFGTFYDDKKMKEDYTNYTTKIKAQEAKLTALEERWYNKFTAMETALAKMESNKSAVASLLGG